MSKASIQVNDLGKRYKLGLTHAGSIRELVGGWAGRIFPQRTQKSASHGQEVAGKSKPGAEFWALQGVSFDVEPGEVLGVIGRNGAGKSTLMKILSRVTRPTTGSANLFGRVGSLLEVGTGFHPELTGRENVFMNGTILGMTRSEIRRKYDEILEFADVTRFIDTPVKRYSSGMKVRLGFAVAAHLEPEILVVDEVLAVGDLEFQRKCLGKMEKVSRSGRTILFVSHNMGAIRSLCSRAILIENGQIIADGKPSNIVDQYAQLGSTSERIGQLPEDACRVGTGEARFREVGYAERSGVSSTELQMCEPIKIEFALQVRESVRTAHFEIRVATVDGTVITSSQTSDPPYQPRKLDVGWMQGQVGINARLLPGAYRLGVSVFREDGRTIDSLDEVLDLTVSRSGGDESDYYRWEHVSGFVRPATDWQFNSRSAIASHQPFMTKERLSHTEE